MLRTLPHTIWSDLSRKCCYIYTPDYYLIFNSIHSRVSVCVCLSVCLCTNVKAMLFDQLPPNLIHTLKICWGRFVRQFQSARLVERALSEEPLFVALMVSCTTANHDRLAKHKLSTRLWVWKQNQSCAKLIRSGTCYECHAWWWSLDDQGNRHVLKRSKSTVLKYGLAARLTHERRTQVQLRRELIKRSK